MVILLSFSFLVPYLHNLKVWFHLPAQTLAVWQFLLPISQLGARTLSQNIRNNPQHLVFPLEDTVRTRGVLKPVMALGLLLWPTCPYLLSLPLSVFLA